MLATTVGQVVSIVFVAVLIQGARGWEVWDIFARWSDQADSTRLDSASGYEEEAAQVFVHHVTRLTISSQAPVFSYPKVTAVAVVKRKLGSTKWDAIHEGLRAQKRDGETCPQDYQLCPKTLNGGCCPNDRVCGESSCLPGSSSTALACGRQNYFACNLDDGGGCCPNNYQCGQNGCTPLPGAASTMTCGASSYLCPASVNYGCCRIGLGCGFENCYSTAISSFTITQTITTTDSNSIQRTFTTTITSTTTPLVPENTATREILAGVVPKVNAAPSSLPKTPGTTKESGGLTRAQLGGIIGGAVGLLLALLIATFFILRRLNKAIKASTDANSRSKTSTHNAGQNHQHPTTSDIDAMSVDPLMMSPSAVSGTPRYPSSQGTPFEADSSPVFRSPFSPIYPPHTTYQSGYNTVATSDGAASHTRHGSMESTPSARQSHASYFDIPVQDRRPYQHGRQWSNTSSQSAGSQEMAELDAGADGDRRSSFQRALQGVGKVVSRRGSETSEGNDRDSNRRSDGGRSLTGNRGPVNQSLGFITEAGESRVQVGTFAKPAGNEQRVEYPYDPSAYSRRDGYG